MSYFFKLGENMYDFSSTMGTFTGQHAFALLLTLAWALYTVHDYKKSSHKAACRKRAVIMVWLVILSRHVVEFATGQYTVHRLPFHLCTVFCLFKIADAWKENNYTKEVLFLLTFPAALLANLFPDWTNQPLWNFNTIQQFAFHAMIINYVLMRYFAGEIQPQLKKIWMPMTALYGILPFIFFINHQLGTNFFFISAYSPGSPLESIYRAFGAFYVPVVAMVLLVIWLAIYLLLWVFCQKKLHLPGLGSVRNKISA